MMTRSEMIKNIRLKLMLDRDEFAKLVGVSRYSINFYEVGLRTPKMQFLRKIKEIADSNNLEFDIDDFFKKGN